MPEIKNDTLEHLNLETYVAFDVETTGLDPDIESVIQFSAVKFVNGQIDSNLNYFCNPGKDIPPFIQELTRITDEMVVDEPSFEEKIPEILDFFGDAPLVAHNAPFDMKFLQKASGGPVMNPVIDTLELSRIFLYYLPDRKLETLAAHFDLETEGAHRADIDTRNTGRLFIKLLDVMLYYDIPLYKDIIFITDPLRNHPNYDLYRNISAYYEKIGRKAKESLKPYHEVKNNKYGKFEKSIEENDSDDYVRRISRQEIDKIFSLKGTLSKNLPNYELRLGQLQMAGDVVESFNDGHCLIAEAGTGVGKSLAYLIPAVKWMKKNRQNGMSIVVSSQTKNLQEQLFFKDIPFIYNNVEDDLNVVLLKGRQNYICLTKWDLLMKNLQANVTLFERAALLPLLVWMRETKTGDIEENSGFQLGFYPHLWSRLCSEPGYCTTKKCVSHNGCYLGKIRRLAHLADVIIVNHSLLLSDAVSNQSILPYHPILIADEAHNLIKTAYRFLGSEITDWGIQKILNKFYMSGMIRSGILVNLGRQIGSDADWNTDDLDMIRKRITVAENDLDDFSRRTITFFKDFLNYVNVNKRKPDQKYIMKCRYKPGEGPFTDISSAEELLTSGRRFIKCIDLLKKEIDSLSISEKSAVSDVSEELDTAFTELETLQETLETAFNPDDENLIYWYEIPKDVNNHHICIKIAPLHVNEVLFEKVFSNKHSIVATSATLTVADRFKYFANRSGLNFIDKKRRIEKQYESPFNYSEQSNIWCVTQFSQPGNAKFDEQAADLIGKLSREFKLGTLVLTTSYASIRNIRKTLEPMLKSSDVQLITQMGAASRTALLQRFIQNTQSVLVGTESFWEGVDIPGEPLEMLIMTKLPFGVPSEPVVQALTEDIKKRGGNPFMEYHIPEAILKFKQGMGRLIRSKKDRGISLILDNRLSFKRYGQYFLQSISAPVFFVKSENELMNNIEIWMKKNKYDS